MSDGLHNITAAILAGGQGTRLRAVVADRQKVVASVAGRPFLMRLLDQLADAGLRRVVICTGYKAGQVAEMAGNEYRGMSLRYSPEPGPLGTAGALRNALPLLESDPVLTMNGDSYCETDLVAFWKAHRERHASGSMVVREVADTSQSGRVSFDQSGAIGSFVEKGASAGPGWINAGIYLLGRALLEGIPAERPVSLERETFPAWIGRGLCAFPTAGKFLDIGTPESYAAAQKMFP
ncbi:MAG: nucleotidyltransferase family protein [Verrucomicrobia bacterium]|nr:nucleotidyltransferase family protein [Verrucomicrobiota bacterium]